jgi:hypothetical protein
MHFSSSYDAFFGHALFPDKASINTPPQSTFHPSLVTGFFYPSSTITTIDTPH